MITTITPTTLAAMQSHTAASITLIVTLTLILLLILKEIASSLDQEWAARLNRALNAAIFPILIMFAVSVVFRVIDLLH